MQGSIVRCLLTAGVVLSVALSTQAATRLSIDGQVRSRTEVDRKEFSSDFTVQSFSDLRTRLGLRALINENTEAYVQFQDSRRLGGTSEDGDSQSGTLVATDNIDVHQAYLCIMQLWANGPGLKAGRFEVNLGNQRVFGAVGWHNVGRSWEGITADWVWPNVALDLFWLKRLEVNDEIENKDFDLFGFQIDLAPCNIELFTFYEYHASFSTTADNNALDRISSGFYYQRLVGQFDFESNVVYQFGEQVVIGAGIEPNQDISAFLVTFEAGYSTDRSRIAVAVDYASGDDDPADDSYTAYDNLYYTGHKFRGYMDYFIASNTDGLLDLIGRFSTTPIEGWKFGADLHYFRSADPATDLGGELDLYASTSRIQGVNWTSGASVFVPSEEFGGENADPGFWLYTMFTVNFSETILD